MSQKHGRHQKSWRRRLADRARDRLLLVCVACVLSVAVYVVVGRQVVQLVPDFRAQLQTLLSERLQATVSIGYLGARMDGLTPVLEMANVSLSSASDDADVEPLRIRRLELGVDLLPSLVNRGLRASELLVEGVQVRLEQRPDGSFMLKGIDALGNADQPRDPAAVRQLLTLMYRQKQLLVNNLDVIVDLPDSKPVVFTDVELGMVTSGERHRVALLAREREERLMLDVRFSLDGDAFALADINGSGYLRVTADQPDFLHKHLPDLPVQLASSQVDIKSWLSVQAGEAVNGHVRVRVGDLPVSHSYLSQPVTISDARFEGALSREGDSYQLALAGSETLLDDTPLRLPPLTVSLTPGAQEQPLAWAVTSGAFDVANLHATVRALPIAVPEAYQALDAMVADMAPTGVVSSAWLSGEGPELGRFSVRFADMAVAARGKVPGARGVSGWLSGSPTNGVVSLDSKALTVLLPRLYHDPLTAQVSGTLGWHRQGALTRIETGWLEVDNKHAAGKAQAVVRLVPDKVPELSLVASLVNGSAGNAARYIPLKRLPEAASDWLAGAFEDGQVDRGQFLYQGPVKINPDFQQRRTFQMAFDVRRASLRFLPGWPLITDLSGQVMIDGRNIVGRGISGRFMDTALRGVSADIPEYEADQVPTLILSGKADGPARDLQTVFQDTPLKDQVPAELARWQMPQGSIEADLLVHWPLRADSPLEPTFIASGRVQQATMLSPQLGLDLSGVTGDVFFHLRDGLFSREFSARVLGGEVGGEIRTVKQQVQLAVRGDSSMAAVAGWLDADWMEPLSGPVAYQGQLLLPWRTDANVRIELESTLDDVVVALPAPLTKPAGGAWPLSLAVELMQRGPRVSLSVPGRVKGWLQMDDSGIAAARLGLGDAGQLDNSADDVQVLGALRSVSVEPWVDWLTGSGDGQGTGTGAGDSAALPLDRLALSIGQLDVYGVAAVDAELVVLPRDAGWAVTLDSEHLAGSVVLPEGYSLRGESPMSMVVTRARLMAGEGGYSELDPRLVPVADVRFSGVIADGEDMGQWSFELRPRQDGIAIKSIQAQWRFTQLAGKASWTVEGGSQRTHFLGAATSDHLKRTALAWDLPPLVEGREADAVINLSWPGSPLDVDYLNTRGNVSIDIGPSRIPNTDSKTSALRMLGVMNFGSVSRRLRLDFSDLYKKGLSCDRISGDFEIDAERVETRNLNIKSPSAEFRVAGTINMEDETVDQRVDVTLPVSSNLYLGCLAGPTACAGIFVVERLWGSKLEKMTSVAYSVTGSWVDPQVTEIEGMFERKK